MNGIKDSKIEELERNAKAELETLEKERAMVVQLANMRHKTDGRAYTIYVDQLIEKQKQRIQAINMYKLLRKIKKS